jgi:hypothetical protein
MRLSMYELQKSRPENLVQPVTLLIYQKRGSNFG